MHHFSVLFVVIVVCAFFTDAFPGVPGYGGGGGSSKASFSAPLALSPGPNYGSVPVVPYDDNQEDDEVVGGVGYIGGGGGGFAPAPVIPKKRPTPSYGGSFSDSSTFVNSGPVGPVFGHEDFEPSAPTSFIQNSPSRGSTFPQFSQPSSGYGSGNLGGSFSVPQHQPNNVQLASNPLLAGPSGYGSGAPVGQQVVDFGGAGKGRGNNKNRGPVGGYGGGVQSLQPSLGFSQPGFNSDFTTSFSSSSSSTFGSSGPQYQPARVNVQAPSFSEVNYPSAGLKGATYSGAPVVGAPYVADSPGCCGGKKNKQSGAYVGIVPVAVAIAPVQVPQPQSVAVQPAVRPKPVKFSY